MTVRDGVRRVLERDACSGCGLCAQLDRGLRMQLDSAGYLRPAAVEPADEIPGAARVFTASCPGVRVNAQHPAGSTPHPYFGSSFGAWEAWAVDPDLRHAGSSGGALTALHAWLIDTGRAARVVSAAASAAEPRRTVPVTITSRVEALESAGSRYAPVGVLAHGALRQSGTVVTGKPCEVSALRAAGPLLVDGETPLLLSFFCAGTPSQRATERLLANLGIDEDREVQTLKYRGDGWPGTFSARAGDVAVETDYASSWGEVLGPTTQWRCKICPDGVGESADIVSADSWATDERGYPVFTEGDGISALIARTARGNEVIAAAVAAGVIGIRPLSLDALTDAQPLQVNRRRLLLARLWGSRLAGRSVPRFRGFGLAWLSATHPRQFVRVLRGAYRRVRAAKARPS